MTRSAPRAKHAREPGRLRWLPTLRRGDLFRIRSPDGDPKRARVFVVVSRPEFLATRYSSAICAPIYSQRIGVGSEVDVGPAEGLKHTSAIRCDLLTSLARSQLTDFIGTLGPQKIAALTVALRIALDIE